MNALNSILVERAQIVPAFLPVDINGAAQTGDWVSLKNFQKCTILLIGAAGSSGTDVTMTVQQATDVSGTGAKALNFTRIDAKEAASSLTAVGQFTTTTQSAANTYTTTNNEQLAQVYAVTINAEDMDLDNDFDCLNVSVNAGNAAKVMVGLYILEGAKFGTDPLPSAIAN